MNLASVKAPLKLNEVCSFRSNISSNATFFFRENAHFSKPTLYMYYSRMDLR